MHLTEAFAELDLIYAPPKKDLTEGRSMPYALVVLLDGEWKVYKGLDFELTNNELADFLSDKPEYSDAKVISVSDIPRYVKKKPVLQEDSWLSREELITELEKLGYKYKFDKYSDRQLYSILKKTKAKIESDKALAELEYSKTDIKPICDGCGNILADSGICPKCYDGAVDLDEGVFDNKPSDMTNWKASSGIQLSSTVSSNNSLNAGSTSKKIVTIFYDSKARKLRAQADDGVNGIANVAFPNHLRNQAGQQYEVDSLIWNGKNYRVSGDIKPVSSVANTQNINKNTNKENYEMNFQTILEELDRIYEELPAEETFKKEVDEVAEVSEACDKALTEDSDEEVLIDDEPIVEEPKQLVLECSKCGALAIRAEADVKVDEETDLANVEDACQYCEETAGYKIIGIVAPFESINGTEDVIEEGLFDKKYEKYCPVKDLKTGDLLARVEVYNEEERDVFSHRFNKPVKIKNIVPNLDGSFGDIKVADLHYTQGINPRVEVLKNIVTNQDDAVIVVKPEKLKKGSNAFGDQAKVANAVE